MHDIFLDDILKKEDFLSKIRQEIVKYVDKRKECVIMDKKISGNENNKIVRVIPLFKRDKRVVCMCKPISNIRGKSAQELLALGGQSDAIPVDLKALLNKLNISCMAFDFTSLDEAREKEGLSESGDAILGALVTNGNNAVIFYRIQDQEEGHRYRFTIAHELAHACLDHYEIGEASIHLAYRSEKLANDRKEYDANVFAGQLLIPRSALERVLGELIQPTVEVLASIFAVSENVMVARLKHLELFDKVKTSNC